MNKQFSKEFLQSLVYDEHDEDEYHVIESNLIDSSRIDYKVELN